MRKTVLSFITGALVIALGVSPALAQTRSADDGHGSHGRHGAAATAAVAHLQAVGGATGWGRLMINDGHGWLDDRSANLRLFDLAPEATYTVEVNGVLLATVDTDLNGDAWLQLGSHFDQLVPEDVPATAELKQAEVLDESLALTLSGDFFTTGSGGTGWGAHGDLVHYERIYLVNDLSYWPRGMARVARRENGEELFDTHAGGLDPGLTYLVTVDGELAGQVVADTVGYASLTLSTADPESPLPAELQPVDTLRQVLWTHGGDTVLHGTFSGVSQIGDCDGGGGPGGDGGGGPGDGGDGGGGPGDGGNDDDHGHGGDGGDDHGHGGDGGNDDHGGGHGGGMP